MQWGYNEEDYQPFLNQKKNDVGLRIGHVPPICGNPLMEK